MPTGPTITVLTAALNAAQHIGGLATSIASQVDKDFKWLVVDGGSTDTTVDDLLALALPQLQIVRTQDFGIYDALNQGIARITTDYYLVCGADDRLSPDCIASFRAAGCVTDNMKAPDLVASRVLFKGGVRAPKQGLGWLYGLEGEAASHSVGLLIKTDLHRSVGLYSRSFPIAADQYFLMRALKEGHTIRHIDMVTGAYAHEGTSGQDRIGTILEIYRIQLRLGRNRLLQTTLMFARVLKTLLLH